MVSMKAYAMCKDKMGLNNKKWVRQMCGKKGPDTIGHFSSNEVATALFFEWYHQSCQMTTFFTL